MVLKHIKNLNVATGLQWVRLAKKEFLATKELREVLTLLLGIDLILTGLEAEVYYSKQVVVIRYENGQTTVHSGIKPRSVSR